MKAAFCIFLLVAVTALAELNHPDLELLEKDPYAILPHFAKPTTTQATTTTEQITTTTDGAGSTLPPFLGDYELVGNFGYYKINETKCKWGEAWLQCKREGAHLLLIRTQEEYDALNNWKEWGMPPYVYYGAHHNFENHKFVTIFDEPLESIPYHTFGWDYSNTTFFNNRDYNVMVVALSRSVHSSDIYLTRASNNNNEFICKKDIV